MGPLDGAALDFSSDLFASRGINRRADCVRHDIKACFAAFTQ